MSAKKVIFAFGAVLLVISILISSFFLIKHIQKVEHQKVKQGYFSVGNYQYVFQDDIPIYAPDNGYENVGPVEDSKTAIQKATELFNTHLGEFGYSTDKYILNEVLYDKKELCWCVIGNFPRPNTEGLVPMAIIREDGEVIAVWYG